MSKHPKKIKPNPGTQEAIDAGCTCPVMDNGRGWGFCGMGGGKGIYCYSEGCPIHWPKEQTSQGGEDEEYPAAREDALNPGVW